MNHDLPLLETFVRVARLGSMKAAAEALSLTAGAISQRIRALEERAGAPLFIRTRSGVDLAPAGRALFAAIDAPFRAIETEALRLGDHGKGNQRQRVTVSSMASFASEMLVPRLGRFTARYPQIDVTVDIDLRVVDLKTEPVDIAIRHGLGDYPGLEAISLLAPAMIVVGSPDLLKGMKPPKTPADCLHFPLLHDRHRQDWRLWLAAHGVTAPGFIKGPAFADDMLLARAAAAGQGLALVRDVYAEGALKAGRLVKALKIKWPTHFAYYAVATAESLQRPAVRRFRDWLVEEMTGPDRGDPAVKMR